MRKKLFCFDDEHINLFWISILLPIISVPTDVDGDGDDLLDDEEDLNRFTAEEYTAELLEKVMAAAGTAQALVPVIVDFTTETLRRQGSTNMAVFRFGTGSLPIL